MLGGAACLLLALILGQTLGGFGASGMTPLAWIVVAVCGLAFVHAQTMSMAILVTLVYDGVVTSEVAESSDESESDTGTIKT